MTTDLSTKSCLIADNGLFCELAPVLARSFGHVEYFVPWASAYPRQALAVIGEGLEKVRRVATFWDRVADADLIVFPDLYFSDWQQVIDEKYGKPLWGHRKAEFLELDRRGARRLQKELDIPAPRTRYFTGVRELSSYLEHHEDRWVKISCYRGDGETWHHETWPVSKIYLDHFKNRVGKLADQYEFLVENPVEGIEIGYDGWTVHGDFPQASYWGIEIKDEAYVGVFSPYEELPEPVRFVNEKVSPILCAERAVGFCSFEFRYNKEGVPYLIDPCLRAGSPPFEVLCEAYTNLAEIIWDGAHGRLAVPEPLGKYTAMAIIHSNFALTNWVPISLPPELRRWVKLRNAAVIEDELYHVPVGGEMPELGAVIGVAGTLQKAIDLVKERSQQVKGYNLDIRWQALDKAQEEIDRARELGITF